MVLPSKYLYKETLSKNEQVPVQKCTGQEPFAMLTRGLLERKDLTPAAKIVLAGMGIASKGTGRVAVSDAVLGKLCGLGRTTVTRCRPELEKAGMIAADGSPVKQVQPYKILAARMVSAAAEGGQQPQRMARQREWVTCSKCARKVPSLLKVGHCRRCNWEMRVSAIADERIKRAKTA